MDTSNFIYTAPSVQLSAAQSQQNARENPNQKHKPKLSSEVIYAGTAAASMAAYFGLNAVMKKPLSLYSKFFLKLMRLDKPTTELFKVAVQKSFQKSGLEKKGVKIKFLANSETNRNELRSILHAGVEKTKLKFLKNLKIRLINKKFKSYIDGNNACCIHHRRFGKSIFLHEDKIISAYFHEQGHAKSFQSNTIKYEARIGHTLEKYAKWLIGACIFMPPPPKNSSKSSKRGYKNFEKAAPAALFLTKIPRLLEEGRASVYGINFAKQVLPSHHVSKLKKAYLTAFGSYLLPALIVCGSLRTMFAVKNKTSELLEKYSNQENKKG